METRNLTLLRKEERLNVIYIPVTGTGRNLGFGISSGLETFEGERVKANCKALGSNRSIN